MLQREKSLLLFISVIWTLAHPHSIVVERVYQRDESSSLRFCIKRQTRNIFDNNRVKILRYL